MSFDDGPSDGWSIGERLMHPGEAVGKRLEVEIGKRLVAGRDVEETVREVRPRAWPGHGFHLGLRRKPDRHQMGDVAERCRDAGDRVELADAAAEQDKHRQPSHVLDGHMIAFLLAVAKNRDRFALRRLPAKAIWAIT